MLLIEEKKDTGESLYILDADPASSIPEKGCFDGQKVIAWLNEQIAKRNARFLSSSQPFLTTSPPHVSCYMWRLLNNDFFILIEERGLLAGTENTDSVESIKISGKPAKEFLTAVGYLK